MSTEIIEEKAKETVTIGDKVYSIDDVSPTTYFNYVKDMRKNIEDENLQTVADNCLELLKKTKITGQTKIAEKIEKGEWITSDDLCQAIMTDGIENVRFMVPLNTAWGLFLNGNEFKDTLCKVEERWNREIKQNYKIVLIPEEPDDSVACSCDYYTTDFVSLIKKGYIKIVA